jgi:hypothetical protein
MRRVSSGLTEDIGSPHALHQVGRISSVAGRRLEANKFEGSVIRLCDCCDPSPAVTSEELIIGGRGCLSRLGNQL